MTYIRWSSQPERIPPENSIKSLASRIGGSYEFKFALVVFSLFIASRLFPGDSTNQSGFQYTSTVLAFNFFLVIPMALLILTGNIDLSVGSINWISFMLYSSLVTKQMATGLAAIFALGASAILGFINGWIVVKFKISSWIATLAMRWCIPSFFFMYQAVFPQPNRNALSEIHVDFQSSNISPWLLIAIFIGIALEILIRKNNTLRQLFWPDQQNPSRFSKNLEQNSKILLFVFSGFMAGLVGIFSLVTGIYVSLDYFQPFTISILAACLIGGCCIWGGSGSILGSFLGAILISILYSWVSRLRLFVYISGFEQINVLVLFMAVFVNALYYRTLGQSKKVRKGSGTG